MKLEKECYIGNVYEEMYVTGRYNVSFNCAFYKSLDKADKLIFDKIKRSNKIKLILEIEEPILDEAERKYLSGVISPFRDDVEFICKNDINIDSEYINIGYYGNDNAFLPCFKKGSMYKGMELNKEYTLEELEL